MPETEPRPVMDETLSLFRTIGEAFSGLGLEIPTTPKPAEMPEQLERSVSRSPAHAGGGMGDG
jgi:hypothetical protein